MEEKSKIIKITIIIFIILCCICGILLFTIKEKDNNIKQIDENGQTIGDTKEVEYKTAKLRDPTKFYSIEKCLQKDVDENFKAKDMNLLQSNRIFNYAVYGKIGSEEKYYIVRIDMENMTYKIEELDRNKHNNNIDTINLETNLKEIAKDGENTFEFSTVTDEQMSRIYLSEFTKLELENAKQAYELLEEEYKKERFPDFKDYQEYLEENGAIIKEAILYKYSVAHFDDYTQYFIIDNFNNSYTLNATGVMNYKIRLDNYTIKVEDYEENYSKLKNENKVQANVHIFLQMINTKDYKHSYELLDETFKNNNFGTLEEYKSYIKENFFQYNQTTSSNINIRQEGNYYIYETTIRNNSGSAAKSKKLTIIMQLLEGTEFVMSFSIE